MCDMNTQSYPDIDLLCAYVQEVRDMMMSIDFIIFCKRFAILFNIIIGGKNGFNTVTPVKRTDKWMASDN